MGALPELFEQFIDAYRRQRPFYATLASHAAGSIEARLITAGIAALVTNRAKSLERVRGKLQRYADRPIAIDNMVDLYRELHDLAGVRIALYFPGDVDRVTSLIVDQFDVQDPKIFPTERTNRYNSFQGYTAIHYVGTLKASDIEQIGAEYSGEYFELQVASVFMHAWAEVEHDLRYKPLSGTPSDDEMSILESLNGLALSAETQLRQLQRAITRRTQSSTAIISNHYELAALLSTAEEEHEQARNLPMGRADVLFEFLKRLSMLDAASISALIKEANYGSEERSIVDALVDGLLRAYPARAALFAEARQRAGDNNPYEPRSTYAAEDTTGEVRFLRLWQLAEATIRRLVGDSDELPVRLSVWRIATARWLETKKGYAALSDIFKRLEHTRRVRNRFVHEGYAIDKDELATETQVLIDFIETAAAVLPDDERTSVLRDLASLEAEPSAPE